MDTQVEVNPESKPVFGCARLGNFLLAAAVSGLRQSCRAVWLAS
jgi:hypothetical protein